MWYGFNDSWVEWCISEMSGWLQPMVFEVIVDESKILRISNEDEFDKFQHDYRQMPKGSSYLPASYLYDMSPHRGYISSCHINWHKVAQKYCGLEIVPYLWSRRLEAAWYYGWDCESGVIWDKAGVQEVKLIAEYNLGNNMFMEQ